LTAKDRAGTSVLAYFLSLGQLEDCAKSHETHLDIYHHAIAMNRKFKEKREVVTWHEIFIMPATASFEYVNCHPKTGVVRNELCPTVSDHSCWEHCGQVGSAGNDAPLPRHVAVRSFSSTAPHGSNVPFRPRHDEFRYRSVHADDSVCTLHARYLNSHRPINPKR
jgi:hypothetical protein